MREVRWQRWLLKARDTRGLWMKERRKFRVEKEGRQRFWRFMGRGGQRSCGLRREGGTVLLPPHHQHCDLLIVVNNATATLPCFHSLPRPKGGLCGGR